MGCDYYSASRPKGNGWEDESITFEGNLSRGDDGYIPCLCTFPWNYKSGVPAELVRSMAYLGAAVALMHHGKLEHGIIPHCLPVELRRQIDGHIKGSVES